MQGIKRGSSGEWSHNRNDRNDGAWEDGGWTRAELKIQWAASRGRRRKKSQAGQGVDGSRLLREGLRHRDPAGLQGGQDVPRYPDHDTAGAEELTTGGNPWSPCSGWNRSPATPGRPAGISSGMVILWLAFSRPRGFFPPSPRCAPSVGRARQGGNSGQ